MEKGKSVRDLIKNIANGDSEIYSVIGKVTKTDPDKRVCVVNPIDESPEIFGVRYSPTDGDSLGLIVNPAVGSLVVVTFLSDNDAFVSLMTEFETIVVKNESADLKQILLDIIQWTRVARFPTPAGKSHTAENIDDLDPIEDAVNNLFE